MRTRSGSSAVFLCIIMSGLASVCICLILCAQEYSAVSRADALANLAADSVLSEYDLDIQREYSLFLLNSTDEELTRKLNGYLRPSLRDMKDIRVSRAGVKGQHPVSVDTSAVRTQILKWMKCGGALVPGNGPGNGSSQSPGQESETDPGGSAPAADDAGGRILRHGPTIASLPSRRLPEQDLADKARAAGRQLLLTDHPLKEGTERYLLESYLLSTFNSCAGRDHSDHFFLYETEYILHGKLSDAENRQAVMRDLKMLRFAPNLAFLYSDPVKREELAAVSEILAPGAGGVLLQLAAATAWALAESSNDARLLFSGRPVPAVKSEDTWAVSAENIPGADSEGVILPKKLRGMNYTDYLRVLLFLEDETLLLSRAMDLIQINMRKDHDSGFLIGACCTGIALQMTVNGRELYYEKTY